MLKREKRFSRLISKEVVVGKPVVIEVNGMICRTSPVVNWYADRFGNMKIETKNTIYLK